MRALAVVLLLSGLARAEDAPAPVRVTVFLLGHRGVEDSKAVGVMRTIEEGLKRNPRLEMKDLDTRLAEFAQELPQEQIDEARQLLAQGQQALTALELGDALKRLNAAVDALIKVLPYTKKQELADAMMALAAAQFEDGDRKAAQRTLLRLYTWRPDFRMDTTKFPPALIPAVEEARHEVERARRGSLEIGSDPAAAQAYVDGRYIGVTPTFAEGLPVGEHFVTLKKEGWRKAVTAVLVSARLQQVVDIPLERSGKYLLVEQALAGVDKALGQPQLDPGADNLKEVLYVDHAVFVRMQLATSGMITVDASLYDLRTRRRLSRVERTVNAPQAEKQLASVGQMLYRNVSYEAELEAPKDAPPPKPLTRAPVYKSWWLWTVLGVAAVGGVLAGVLAPPPPKACASGAFCFGIAY